MFNFDLQRFAVAFSGDMTYNKKKTTLTLKKNFSGTLTEDYYEETVKNINGSKCTGALYIYGNDYNNVIKSGKGDDTLYGGYGNDKLYGGNGYDILYGGQGNDNLYGGSGADMLYGDDGNDKLYGEKGDDFLYVANGNNTLYGGKGNDELYAGTGKDKLYGGDGNDYLYGGNGNALLSGGAGKDTLISTSGNNTLTGGKGKDLFIFEGGNAVITDYTAGSDTIDLSRFNLDYYDEYDIEYDIKGSDVILGIGLTIKKGAFKKITIIDNNKQTKTVSFPIFPTGTTYNKSKKTLTVSDDFNKSRINLADLEEEINIKIKKVNAAALTSSIAIYGSNTSNSIKGGSGDDTLDGGGGTNTLTGGKGNDVFVFNGEGKTTITDYKEGEDVIQINGTISDAKASGSNFVFTVNGKKLIVKKGAKKEIAVKDSSGGTHYYGKYYEERWFAEDNNFVEINNDNQLSEILPNSEPISPAEQNIFNYDLNLMSNTSQNPSTALMYTQSKDKK